MKTQSLGLLAALLCVCGISFSHASLAQGPRHNQQPPPPPPFMSGSDADLSGSGGALPPPPWVSGSDAPILSQSGGPPPPPWVSGSDTPELSGSGGPPPPPPYLSGSGDPDLSGSAPGLSGSCGPIVSGSGNPPPWAGGTGGLPGGATEILTERIAFTASSGTTTSATGLLQAVGVSGTGHGSLLVRTVGLASGTYTVSAVTSTGTAPVTLGTFDVHGPVTTGTGTAPISHARRNAQFGGRKGIAFPDGFDPFDISTLAISDSNANALFTAVLVPIENGAFDARTPAVTGTSVSGASGVVAIHACAKAGVVTGVLSISASGLPAGTTYTYAVNGTDIGPVTTGTGGTLKLAATEKPAGGTLPSTVDLFTVTSVTVHDSSGNLILSASF